MPRGRIIVCASAAEPARVHRHSLTEKTTMHFDHPRSDEGESGELSSTDESERETIELRETKITSTGTGISEVMV